MVEVFQPPKRSSTARWTAKPVPTSLEERPQLMRAREKKVSKSVKYSPSQPESQESYGFFARIAPLHTCAPAQKASFMRARNCSSATLSASKTQKAS